MKSRSIAAAITLLVAAATPALAQQSGEIAVTGPDSVSVAIYNNGLGLVHDQRRVQLGRGVNQLAFPNVSRALRPATVVLEAAAKDGTLAVLEQNFEFRQLNRKNILRAYVGRKVRVVTRHPTTGEEKSVEAELISVDGGIVLKIGDRIETGTPGRLVFDGLPPGLRVSPTLLATVESGSAQTLPVQLSYLTGGLGWQADYVASLAPDEKSLDLNVWITLTNTSGIDYKDAALRLVAGSVNVVSPAPRLRRSADMERVAAAAVSGGGGGVSGAKFADYHVFTVNRPVTILDRQTKQIVLMKAAAVPVRKEFRVESAASQRRQGGVQKPPVSIYIEFENEKKSRLGTPLPAGVVRVYKNARNTGSLFVGEDRIGHTPEGRKVRLRLGQTFDVTAERKQTDYSAKGFVKSGPGKRGFEAAYEVELKNAGKDDVEVLIVERIPGDWRILEETSRHKKFSATEAHWTVRVPAGGKAVHRYRVRTVY